MSGSASSAGRHILLEHQYRTTLPYPVACGFARFCTPGRSAAMIARRLVDAAEEALRYAAIVAVSDYITNPSADAAVLRDLHGAWMHGGVLRMEHWILALTRVLGERSSTWTDLFVGEFAGVRVESLKAACEPLLAAGRLQRPQADEPRVGAREFVRDHESDLFSILSELDFLGKYAMCAADVDMPENEASAAPLAAEQAQRQTLQVYRGATRWFAEYEVVMEKPVSPRKVFIWRPGFDGILCLSPFLIYGRAAAASEQAKARRRKMILPRVRGIMVLGSAGAYVSLDQQGMLPLSCLDYPSPGVLSAELRDVFNEEAGVVFRKDVRLRAEERKLFARRPGDMPEGTEFVGERDTYVVRDDPIGRGGMGVVYLVKPKSDPSESWRLKQ